MTACVVHLKLNAKGQLTLPANVRSQLGLKAGDEVVLRVIDGQRAEVVARSVSLGSLDGSLKVKRSASLADMEMAIAQGAAGR